MWVYIIQHDQTKQIYIGKTKDPDRRLKEHNWNQQKATKRNSGKWILTYAEAYRNPRDAEIREMRLKNHGRAKQELFKRIENSMIT